MTFSLYDATVANYLQTLGAVSGFLDKGMAHFNEKGVDLGSIVDSRLAPDMRPLRFQIESVVSHSVGAIESAQSGLVKFPSGNDSLDYAGLQAAVADARKKLEALTPDAINGLLGRDVVMQLGERKLPFTAEGFLMSFSLPNFYFHAATAYDILRHKGVPIGKRDFMGRMKMKA